MKGEGVLCVDMLCDCGCSGVWDKGTLCRLGVLIMYKDVCDKVLL